MSIQDPMSLPAFLPKAFNLIFNNILLSPAATPNVLTAASEAIGSQGLIRYCVTEEMILSSVEYARQGSLAPGARRKQKTPFLTRIIATLTSAFESQALLMGQLLPILTSLVSKLRLRVLDDEAAVDPTGQGRTAAEELLMDLIRDIGDLRTDKDFEEKGKVDEVLGMAIEVMGVEAVLRALPLNIEPDA
jgi:ribosomal RNA-processing protein 12